MNWYLHVLKNYTTFSGRARRKEYWFFVLFHVLVIMVLDILDTLLGLRVVETPEASVGVLSSLYLLGTLLPSIAVAMRRLHDTERSGWWLLLSLIPLVGPLVLLIFYVLRGTPGDNKYGPDPLAGESAPAI